MNSGDAKLAEQGQADAGGELSSERANVEAARRDPVHFAAVYESNFAVVYGYIVRRVRDRALAEDLTADVFHQALAALPRFEWRGVPFGAWLIRIAANAIADRGKRSQKEQDHLSAALTDVTSLEAPPDAEAALEESERRARLQEFVDRLPADQRTVIAMRFVEERSIRDIAAALGRSEGAVKQLQFRALQTLRAQMTIGEKNV